MKAFLFFLFLSLSCVSAREVQVKAFPFSSKIKNTNKKFSCSATLFKYNGQCHLLTNNHCVDNRTDFSLSFFNSTSVKEKWEKFGGEVPYYTPQFAIGDPSESISVTLNKVNRRLDLAVLNFKSDKLDKLCADLVPFSQENYEAAIIPNSAKNFVATGAVNNEPVMAFTSGTVWNGAYGATQVFHQYNVGSKLYFWHVSDIDIIPGMSGSPVVSNRQGFIGLATKYVDFQNSALVIPTPLILKFIDGEIEDLPEVNLEKYKNNSIHDAGNEHGGAGNEHGGAGNEHGGAGNEHGGAGNESAGPYGNPAQGILASFRAPDEGILVNNEIALGFTSKDGIFGKTHYHQIDGYDEYETKVNDPAYLANLGLKGKMTSMIARPKNGYLDINLRKSILDRMDGFYYREAYESEVAKPFNQNVAVFLIDKKSPKGLSEVGRKTRIMMLDVNLKKKTIILEEENLNLVFNISYSDDYKQIYLTQKNLKLTCDNKHLLKLICSNYDMELSLSLSDTSSSRYVKYRLAYKGLIHNQPVISYWYGAIMAAENPAFWRK